MFEKWERGVCEWYEESYFPSHKCKKTGPNCMFVMSESEADCKEEQQESSVKGHVCQIFDEMPQPKIMVDFGKTKEVMVPNVLKVFVEMWEPNFSYHLDGSNSDPSIDGFPSIVPSKPYDEFLVTNGAKIPNHKELDKLEYVLGIWVVGEHMDMAYKQGPYYDPCLLWGIENEIVRKLFVDYKEVQSWGVPCSIYVLLLFASGFAYLKEGKELNVDACCGVSIFVDTRINDGAPTSCLIFLSGGISYVVNLKHYAVWEDLVENQASDCCHYLCNTCSYIGCVGFASRLKGKLLSFPLKHKDTGVKTFGISIAVDKV